MLTHAHTWGDYTSAHIASPTTVTLRLCSLLSQGFSAWFNDMSQIFNATELAHIAVTFLDSVQVSEKASPVSTRLLCLALRGSGH